MVNHSHIIDHLGSKRHRHTRNYFRRLLQTAAHSRRQDSCVVTTAHCRSITRSPNTQAAIENPELATAACLPHRSCQNAHAFTIHVASDEYLKFLSKTSLHLILISTQQQAQCPSGSSVTILQSTQREQNFLHYRTCILPVSASFPHKEPQLQNTKSSITGPE